MKFRQPEKRQHTPSPSQEGSQKSPLERGFRGVCRLSDVRLHQWMLWLVMSIGLLVWLSFALTRSLWAQGSVTPEQIEVSLQAGQCSEETVTVTPSEAPIPKLDLVFVIDVTSSMSPVINEVTRSAGTIVADTRSLVSDTAFGLGTLSDYQGGIGGLLFFVTGYGGPGDYPWRIDQDISTDERALQAALNNLELKFGGDGPESYLRALYETEDLSWRDGSRRIVILFGDSFPHDPDPGVDTSMDTDDDLTLAEVLQQLADHEISVITVYTESSNQAFYQAVADETGGQAFFLQRTEEIPQRVKELVESRVSRIRALTLVPTSPGNAWLQWEPKTHTDVAPLESKNFALTLCVPSGTEDGDYTFDLSVTGDRAEMGRIPVLIHVKTVAQAFPWWLLLPLILLPLLLAVLFMRRKGRPTPTSAPSRPTGGRPTSRSGSRPTGRPETSPTSKPSKAPTSGSTGQEVTHGKGKPSMRR